MGAELFNADRRTDVTKLNFFFAIFSNVLKNQEECGNLEDEYLKQSQLTYIRDASECF